MKLQMVVYVFTVLEAQSDVSRQGCLYLHVGSPMMSLEAQLRSYFAWSWT